MATVTPFPTQPIPPDGIAPAVWSQALDAAYAKAQTAMPDLGERLARALALVRAGAVEHAAQWGAYHYTVASASDPTGLTTYDVHAQAPMSCTCEDFTREAKLKKAYACKHLLAAWLYRRALEQVPTPLTEAATEPQSEHTTVAQAPEGHPLPEAALSLCLKGRMHGVDTQLTIRGQTRAEFMRHLQDVLDLTTQVETVCGLFDAPTAPAASAAPGQPTAEGRCVVHSLQMERQSNERGSWYSHKTADGWCRGKKAKG